MRLVVLAALLFAACAHQQPAEPQEPMATDQRLEQMQQEQRAENARAEKHRRFERSQAVFSATQAPWKN